MDKETVWNLEEMIFAISYDCPSWCDYCYNVKHIPESIARHGFRLTKPRLELDGFRRVVDQAIPLGLSAIQICGGEPLMNRGLVLEMTKLARSYSLEVTLFTNGYFVDKELACALAESGLVAARISLGGANYGQHSQERHDPEDERSWERLISAIYLLKSAGISVGTLTPVTRRSLADLGQTAAFALSSGADFATFHRYIPSGIDEQDRTCDLSPDEHMRALDEILSARDQYGADRVVADYGLFEFLSPKWKPSAAIRECKCGRKRLGVLADGRLSTCSCAALSLGDITASEFDLKSIWADSPILQQMRHPSPHTPCDLCKWWKSCYGACPSYAANPSISLTWPSVCPVIRTFTALRSRLGVRSAAKNALESYDAYSKCTEEELG